jgi:2'-hydroxyisoflavone reductase
MNTEIDRRDFLIRTSVAGAALLAVGNTALGLGNDEQGANSNKPSAAEKPLRILILGGTGFIGPHFVRACVNRGHKVSVFNRGKDHADLPPNVERLIGDRNGDLESIKNRAWDSVIDLAVYTPIWVRTVGEALQGRVMHYTFISTIMTYSGLEVLTNPPIEEDAKLVEYKGSDPYGKPDTKQYGPLKVLCEGESESQFAGRTLVVRPDYIIGPGDPYESFTYWVARLELGGEVLAPGNPLESGQFIDVRDLAEWTVRMVEKGETGAYNAVGPAAPMSLGEVLGAIRSTYSVPTTVTWAPVSWLAKQETQMNDRLLMWTKITGMSNKKAVAKGLTYRPLDVTVADTHAWNKSRPAERQAAVISADMAVEQKLLAAWHSDQGKAVSAG